MSQDPLSVNEAGDLTTRHWLERLGDAGTESQPARNALLQHASARLERLARAMLRGYPRLRRWEATDDVLQNALLRLHQALNSVRPATSREFYGLAALQIRRELIDLSRRHFGPLGAAAHHATTDAAPGAESKHPVEASPDCRECGEPPLDWQAFHEAVEILPDKERETVGLLWYQGLKQGEAARLLGVSERTIKNRWQRARQLLERKLPWNDWLPGNDEAGAENNAADLAWSPPELLADRYRRDSLIARGGFSQVWRASDLASGRQVAIKVTTRDCLAEARRVARLQHHGIVAVRDSGRQADFCFIVFDLVEGADLAALLRTGPLDWRRAARIVAEAARRLDFAHRQGFVHRDIKPANILVGDDGRVVLADFGIAVTQEELRRETLTSAGTLAYMAPEQLASPATIDARTDVYGLGVVLYQALTGRLPFFADDLSKLRRRILDERPVAPSEITPGIPESISQIALRCLAKRPSERYASAAELADELEQAAGGKA